MHGSNTVYGPSVSEINKLPVDKASAVVGNRTVMTYDPGVSYCLPGKYPSCHSAPGHGTQIEYFAANGMAFLWYPGNRRPVPARWKLEKQAGGYDICFKYPSRSYNPITRQHGGHWQCRSFGGFAARIKEIRENDVFKLSTGRLPHVLNKSETTFDTLLGGQTSPVVK